VEFDDFMVGKIADVNRDFFERFLVLQLVVRLKGYSNRVIIGGLSLILVFWIFSFRSPGTGVLVNAGRSTTFLVARAGGEPLHFFHKSSIAAPRQTLQTPRGSPKNRGFGQWIRVGWPSLGRCLGGGRFPKRDGDYTEIDVKSKTYCNFMLKSSVFFWLQLFKFKLHT